MNHKRIDNTLLYVRTCYIDRNQPNLRFNLFADNTIRCM